MPQPYYYDDGTRIEVEYGAIGLDPKFVVSPGRLVATRFGTILVDATTLDEVQLFYERELKNIRENRPMAKVAPLGSSGDRQTRMIEEMQQVLASQYGSGPAAGNSHTAAKKPIAGPQQPFSELNNKAVIEIIHYGRAHRYEYSPELWQILAPIWRTCLIREGRDLLRSIQYQAEIIENWTSGVVGDPEKTNVVQRYAAYYTAGVVEGIHWVRDWWNKNQPSTLDEYKALEDRTVNAWTNVTRTRDASYPVLHELGIEFMRIFRRLTQLEARLFADLEQRTESGKKGQEAAEFVESHAATLWDLYAQLRAGGSAQRLALYRLGILGVRAGFRGGSDYVLAGSDGEKVLRNFADFAIPEGARILTDWIMGNATGFRRLVRDKDNRTVRETIATELMKIALTILFDAAIWYLYDSRYKQPPISAQQFGEEQRKKIAISLVKSVVYVIGRGSTMARPLQKKLIEMLVASFGAALDGLVADYSSLKQTADAEHHGDLLKTFLDDYKFYTMRFVGRFAIDLAEGGFAKSKSGQGGFAKDKMKENEQQDRAKARDKAKEKARGKMGVKANEWSEGDSTKEKSQAAAQTRMEIIFDEGAEGLGKLHELLDEFDADVLRSKTKADKDLGITRTGSGETPADRRKAAIDSSASIKADEFDTETKLVLKRSADLLAEWEDLKRETDYLLIPFEQRAVKAAQQIQAGDKGRDDAAELKKSPLMIGVPAERFPPEAVRKDAVDESDGNVTVQDIKKEDLDLMCQGPLRERGFLEREELKIHEDEKVKRKHEQKVAAIRAARERLRERRAV